MTLTRWKHWPIIILLLIGTAVRFYDLGAQALRGDEAFNVGFAQMPWAEMVRVWQYSEPHPPLQFLVLREWITLAGRSDFAVRWPGAIANLLAMVVVYRLGREWFGYRVALIACLLFALNPFSVWYAQDARMYPFLPIVVVAGSWLTWRATQRPGWRPWLWAGIVWTLGLFFHYFVALSLACTGAALVLAPRTRRAWLPALGMALGIGLIGLIWLAVVSSGIVGQVRTWEMSNVLPRIIASYSVGEWGWGTPLWSAWVGGLVFSGVCVIGVSTYWKRNSSAVMWLMAVTIGTPFLSWLATASRSAFEERFHIGAVPLALLLAATGLAALIRYQRVLGTLALVGLIVPATLTLTHQFFDPAFRKSPDWHGLIRYLHATERPSDSVVVNLPDPAFYQYYTDGMPVETSPPGELARVGITATVTQLEGLIRTYNHIRFLYSPFIGYDSEGFVEQWLLQCCELLRDEIVSGFRVQTFDTPRGSLAARQPYPVAFEEGLTLTGYRVATTTPRAGEALPLTLFWQGAGQTANDYTVFVQFLAADGFYISGADGLPRTPTSQMTTTTVIDSHIIQLPPDLPPGDYQIVIGLYQPEANRRLSATLPDGAISDQVRLPIIVTLGLHP